MQCLGPTSATLPLPVAVSADDDTELEGLRGRLVKRKEHAGEEDGASMGSAAQRRLHYTELHDTRSRYNSPLLLMCV